ncbi:exodeoxyribonuclease VII large subunit [Pararhizobium mangrovi]|uniref:Exodeoxyribonuclease 7 large subunit n=1 Tax=Pararhizobium mangrovi TaxID=2590452 RepID=A0A506U1M5_9HYPH|nr:exodeoxyribonuclease VII large subunit [Pararhizobium mangrovi]TPW26479.1 exodeoxyribonuclease VII large subunit [Pararhizobium mangrovi]
MAKSSRSDSPVAGDNLVEYSVSEISGSIKRTMENAFGRVRIRGEISGYRGPHSSGHAYFSLKDERSRIEAVVWRTTFAKLKIKPEEGMEMIATGRVTTFAGASKYQIAIEQLEPAGAGALMALLEERRRTLAAEGLFDETRKRALPFMPRVVGVVTSPTGAVIRDILHRITDRFPLHVVVWPVRVQGETCGREVAAAIEGFSTMAPGGQIPRPDLVIVARGGGSLEDLWGFNDEIVVRAAAASTIPLVSAVGHETDWTLIDYAADRRAPTPTGAAEIAVPVRAELEAELAGLAARLRGATTRRLDLRRQDLRALARALPSLDGVLALPRRRFDEAASRLDRALDAAQRDKRAAFERAAARLTPTNLAASLSHRRQYVRELAFRGERHIERRSERARARIERIGATLSGEPARLFARIERGGERLASQLARMDAAQNLAGERRRRRIVAAERMLASLSYRNVLARGFALVRDEAGIPVKTAASLAPNAAIAIEFSDGVVDAVTRDEDRTSAGGTSKARPQPRPRRPQKETATPAKQGSLF